MHHSIIFESLSSMNADQENESMIYITVCSDTDETKRLTVNRAQCVHRAVAVAFGCERQEQVQRVLFGDDTDVFEGESFEDHGIEVGGVTLLRTV